MVTVEKCFIFINLALFLPMRNEFEGVHFICVCTCMCACMWMLMEARARPPGAKVKAECSLPVSFKNFMIP